MSHSIPQMSLSGGVVLGTDCEEVPSVFRCRILLAGTCDGRCTMSISKPVYYVDIESRCIRIDTGEQSGRQRTWIQRTYTHWGRGRRSISVRISERTDGFWVAIRATLLWKYSKYTIGFGWVVHCGIFLYGRIDKIELYKSVLFRFCSISLFWCVIYDFLIFFTV